MSVVSCKLSIPLCAGESANSSLLTHSALAHSLDAWNTVISPQFKVSLFIIVCSV